MGRCCTNRNRATTIPASGGSPANGVRVWSAHVGHRIEYVARMHRFGRLPTRCPGSKTIPDGLLVPEERVLGVGLLVIA